MLRSHGVSIFLSIEKQKNPSPEIHLFTYNDNQMQNVFNQQLILKIVCRTLFEDAKLNKDKLYFSKDFIQEQNSFLRSNSFQNQWLRVNIVQTLFELRDEKRASLKAFYLDNIFILKNLMVFQNDGIEPSDEKIAEYLDTLLDIFYNEDIVEGILIECICNKVEDLIAISDEYLIKTYITREDFDELVEFYQS
jgi:hypothetical protein